MYRPTTLRLASENCPRAIDYYEQQRPRFYEVFQSGIAAHECLALVGSWAAKNGSAPDAAVIAELCETTARKLISTGRAFDGVPEPPMRAEDAFEGRDLALRYATADGTVWLTKDVWIERGLAFDAHWRPTTYGKLARFRLIPDVMAMIEDGGEDYVGRLLLVRDYKSAWHTDGSELQTLQLKAQAFAGFLLYGREVDGVRREVINLRTGQSFFEDVWLEYGGREEIEGWRADVTAYMDALDAMRGTDGRRPVRPGARLLDVCVGCELRGPASAGCRGAGHGAAPGAD